MGAAAVFTNPTTLTYARVDGGTRDPLGRDYKVLLDPETSLLMKELGLGGPGLDFTILRQGLMQNGAFHAYSSTKLKLMAGRIVDLAFGPLPTPTAAAQATAAAKTIAQDLLQNDVEALRQEVSDLRQNFAQTEALKKEVYALEADAEALSREKDELTYRLETVRAGLEQEIQGLESNLFERDEALDEHKEEVRQLIEALGRNRELRTAAEDEVKALRQHTEESEKTLENAEKDYKTRVRNLEEQQLEALGERDSAMERLKAEHKEAKGKYAAKIRTLAGQRTQAETEAHELRKHTEELEAALMARQKLLADNTEVRDVLKSALEEAQKDYKTRVKNLEEQQFEALTERDAKIEQLKAERLRQLEGLQAERDRYIAQLSISETARIDLKKNLAIQTSQVEGLGHLLRGEIQTREKLESKIVQLELDKSREAKLAAKEKESLQQLLDIRKGIIADAAQDLQTLHSRVIALTKALEERKEHLGQHTDQIDRLNTHVDKLEEHLKVLKAQIAAQQTELEDARKPKTISIVGFLEDLEKTSAVWKERLSNSEKMIEELLTLLEQGADETEGLRGELVSLQTALQETRTSAEAQQQALTAKLATATDAVTQKEADINEIKERQAQSSGEADRLRAVLAKKEETLVQTTSALTKAQEERRALQIQLNEAASSSSGKDSQIQELTKQVVEAKAKIITAHQEKEAATAKLQARLAEKETYIGELETVIMNHQVTEYPQDQIDSLNLTIDDLVGELERLENRMARLTTERDEARATMTRMRDFSDIQDERLRRGLERLHELFPERVGINLEAAKLRTLFFNRIILGDTAALTEAEDVLSTQDFERLTNFIKKKESDRASTIRANQNSPAKQRTYDERLNTLNKLKNKILTSLEKLESASSIEAFGRIINGIIQQQPFFANDLIALEQIIGDLQRKLDERDPTLQRKVEADLIALTNVKTLAQELLAKVNAGYPNSQRASRRRS